MKIGMLTSGGDCPGLNAAIRGVAKAAYETLKDVQIFGILDGYRGLIHGEWKEMEQRDFSGILTLGGTIFGTSRQPFKKMREIEDDNIDKVDAMIRNYKKMGLDCLVTLGGNGTHKTANLLSQEGLNIIGLPKTIDNDLWGTEVTFGFHTAVDIATDAIDRIHTTATSHGRVMIVELMGHNAGWLNLYAGVAGGADIILIPEIPYDPKLVIKAVENRIANGKPFSIIAMSEGAVDLAEADMSKEEFSDHREAMAYHTPAYRLAKQIEDSTDLESRVAAPGHIVRGGSPSPYDRLLSSRFGVYAAELIKKEKYGRTIALVKNKITSNKLEDVAGKLKLIPADCNTIKDARKLGIAFGD